MEQSTENSHQLLNVDEAIPQQYEVIPPTISRSDSNILRPMHQEYQDVLFYGKNN